MTYNDYAMKIKKKLLQYFEIFIPCYSTTINQTLILSANKKRNTVCKNTQSYHFELNCTSCICHTHY